MRSRIWMEKNHYPVMFSRFGASLLLTGLVEESGAALKDISLALKQGTIEVKPKFMSMRAGLLSPGLATHALGGFSRCLDQGFAISMTFPPDTRFLPGLAYLEATFLWSDGLEESLRLATTSVELLAPIDFNVPIGPDTIGIALTTYNPNPTLFDRQINSIRKQSHRDWVCVISDDCSSPTFLAEME
jgi:hypothetical protein